jgi:hypothetical protein
MNHGQITHQPCGLKSVYLNHPALLHMEWVLPSAGWHMSIQDPKLPTLRLVKAVKGGLIQSPANQYWEAKSKHWGPFCHLSFFICNQFLTLSFLVRDRLATQHFVGVKFRHFATQNQTRGVSHCGLAIYIKQYFTAIEELYMETQIFHHAKI